jgi:L-iditol 2-dehydrogenase
LNPKVTIAGVQLDESLKLSLVRRSAGNPGPSDISVMVSSCGICGTDNHIVRGESRVSLPVVLGHEFGGRVIATGDKVDGIKVGDIVAVDPNIACHHCDQCRAGNVHLCENLTAIGVDMDGGMSDVCTVPAAQAYVVPAAFDPRYLPFVEPLSCVLHGLDRIAVRQGEKVLIIGAGTIGLMQLLLLREVAGRLDVQELNSKRMAKAASFGAHPAGDGAPVGYDAVLECSGTVAGFEKAVSSVRPGGRILVFGVTPIGKLAQISPNDIYRRELTIVGSYINPNTFSRSIAMIGSGRLPLSGLDVRYFSLEDFEAAFEASASGDFSKVAFQSKEGD